MPPKPPRRPTHEELQIWELVTRGDQRLPHAEIEWPHEQEKSETIRHKLESGVNLQWPAPAPFTAAGQAHAISTHTGIDRNTSRRLRQGKLAIEATLDLHGMGREEACHRLARFLERAFEEQRRCVLVVTGKGRFDADVGQSEGVLRKHLPRWLALTPCAHWVLSYTHAQPRHGGEGAFYILLRRKRS
jgi:DNA-nicking Smr family endonuclease